MKTLLCSPRRERTVARGRALAAVACALLLVLLVGERVSTEPGRRPVVTRRLVHPTVRAGTQERLRRAPEAPSGTEGLFGCLADSPASDSRLDPRHWPAIAPEHKPSARRLGLAPHAASAPPEDRRPDRPDIANCPPQGPPRHA